MSKNRDEEAAIKRARALEAEERETERRINELNKAGDLDAKERFRRMIEGD